MKQVLVTGASGGIGRAIAVTLAERGVRLALHYYSDLGAAETTRRALTGADHALFSADLSDGAAIEPFWREVMRVFGRVDAVVNNAGIYTEHPPATVADYQTWSEIVQRTLATNFLGPARLSFLAARTMAQRGIGRIVNISSRGAFRGEPTAPAYAASKAALNAFGQSFARAFAAQGVQVFVVAPGWVATERVAAHVHDPTVLADQPLGRVATPEEVANVVTYCLLDAPVSLTGAVLDVNGASYLR
ncbi:MAG TPA: SDR family oxidoreductase [Steroidobacteraceae bacterium]|jgi:3-oxoacyl-[acyl-carrier protein] reductase|nr:SDR family oxidoreductase [Steroidobacteraceae bacterium]